METATFGAGCFWHVELEFGKLKGVTKTQVGYMGGETNNPTYKEVCKGKSNHVEVCQIIFDPKKVSYEKLLSEFWCIHDPTQINRQGFDVGTQYKSIIFFHNKSQKNKAEISKQEQSIKLNHIIATVIEKASKFYPAEDYHQKYLIKKGRNTC
jgi:peptide-methionine (S)-S-oxide reductase